MKKKYYSRNRRVRKAYWTTFVIIVSYLRLQWASKLFGKKYYKKRIHALNVKSANRAKDTILALEGLFIKVGQLLSILTNFLPEEYHEPLDSLQDQLPPRPYNEIQQRIQSEFGKPIEKLFGSFEKQPIATASIGQAHRATTKDGREIVVKVQHFNIENIADVDLEIIKRLTKLAGRFFDIKGLDYAYEQIKQMILDELDFRKEAESMTVIAENLEHLERFKIPRVVPELSSERAMATTFCEGVKISNLAQIDEWQIDRTDLAKRLIVIYIQMVLRDGFYHADPHPGNILIQEDGTIVLLDFGATAYVQTKLKKGIPKLVEAVIKNDAYETLEALKYMDFLSDSPDSVKIAEKIIEAFRRFIEEEVKVVGLDFNNIKNINLFENSMFQLQNEVGIKNLAETFQVPKDYVLLNRTATLLLGISSALDSSLNPLEVSRPYLQQLIKEERGDITNYILKSLRGTVTSAIALPEELQEVLQKTKRGQIEITVRGNKERSKMTFAIAQMAIFTILAIAAIFLGFQLRGVNDLEFSKYSFGVGGLFFVLSWRAMNRAGKWSRLV